MRSFGSLAAVLAARRERRIGDEHGRFVATRLDDVLTALSYVLATEANRQPLLESDEALEAFLSFEMAYAGRERFRAIFLDLRGRILADDVLAEGSFEEVRIPPRRIVFRGLQVEASRMLLVHNHPSGDPKPSREDVSFTKSIHRIGSMLDLAVVDHLIVTRGGCVSMRRLGLLT